MLRTAPTQQGLTPSSPDSLNVAGLDSTLRAQFFEATQDVPAQGLDLHFQGPVLTQEQLIALGSGYHDSFGVYHTAHSRNADGAIGGSDSPDGKKEENTKLFNFARGFSMGGIEFTPAKAVENMGILADRYRAQITENSESLTISENQIARYADGTQIATSEDLEAYIESRNDCLVVELYSADQITMQDGQIIRIEDLHAIEQQNEVLTAAIEEIEFYQAKIDNSEMDISELPEHLQQAILDVELETLNAPAIETAPLSVLDMLDQLETTVEATIQNVVPVTPSVTFSP